MKAHRQETITFIAFTALLALGSASCDLPPVALEMAEAPAVTTVPAADPDAVLYPVIADGGSADGGSASSRFRLDVALVDREAQNLTATILAAARRWADIVRGTDLEDIEREPGIVSCGNRQYNFEEDVLDDILVLVSVQDYFEGPTTGVTSWICAGRESSNLPAIGAIVRLGATGSAAQLVLGQRCCRHAFRGSQCDCSLHRRRGCQLPDGRVPVENYTLPDADVGASAMEAGPANPAKEELVTSPAVFYDRHGNVVRVLRD